MRILYVYMEFLNQDGQPVLWRGLTHFEMNFGNKNYFRYENGKLNVSDAKAALPEGFWGKNIYNVTALAGNNGSGKSTILSCIRELLIGLYEGKICDFNKTILVLEEEGKLITLLKSGGKEEKLEINGRKMELYNIPPFEKFSYEWLKEAIYKTKIIYITNTINEEDYQYALREDANHYSSEPNKSIHVRDRFLYDCSTCGLMIADYRNDIEREKNSNEINWLGMFFSYEWYKQIKYVFDKKQHTILNRLKEQGYLVPAPEKLTITMKPASWDLGLKLPIVSAEDHVITELKEMLAPGAALQINKWKEQAQEAEIVDDSICFADVVVYELCCNCIQSLLRNLEDVLRISQEKEKFDKTLMRYLKEKKPKAIKAEIAKEEFLNMVDMFMEIYQQLVDNETGNRGDLEWMGESSREFIRFVFGEKEKISNHFKMEKPVIYYLLPPSPHSSQLEFSVEVKDAEWFGEFLQKYRYTCNPYYYLKFSWGLSSGEDNLLRLFTSFYYIFEKDYTNEKNGGYKIYNIVEDRKIICESVFLFMDEADLTYHPEWQRQFISILTAFLQKIYPVECCKEIQIILSTHSPLLLGDMPSGNVVYLEKNEENKKNEKNEEDGITKIDDSGRIETFGQNIHIILQDSFFLRKGTLGGFASQKIQYVAEELEEIRGFLEASSQEESQTDMEKASSYINKIKEELNPITNLLAEGIIKSKLMELSADYMTRLVKLIKPGQPYENYSSEQLQKELEEIRKELDRRKTNDKDNAIL